MRFLEAAGRGPMNNQLDFGVNHDSEFSKKIICN